MDETTISLLDEAEDIVNGAGPDIIAEVERQRAAQRGERKRRWWWPFGRR